MKKLTSREREQLFNLEAPFLQFWKFLRICYAIERFLYRRSPIVLTGFQDDLCTALEGTVKGPAITANEIGRLVGRDSRAVATGLRPLVDCGAVSSVYRSGIAYYTLVKRPRTERVIC